MGRPEARVLGILLFVAFSGSPAVAQQVKVGAILDMETLVGKMCWISISMAVQDFYSSHPDYTTRLVVHLKDAKAHALAAGSAGLWLINNEGVLAILGPQKSDQARFLSNIADIAQVPLISFSATSPFLSSSAQPYFVRTALIDSAQVEAIASIIVSQGWREATVVYEDSDYGNGVVPFLIDALQANSVRVPHRSVIPVAATDDQIVEELLTLQMLPTRVFIVHMSLALGARLFSKAKNAGMVAKGYAWILTDGIASLVDSVDWEVIGDMQGFVGVKPYIVQTTQLRDFTRRWKKNYRAEYPDEQRVEPSIFSLWAYDSVTALALAVEKVKLKGFTFQKPTSVGNSTDLDAVAVSTRGPAILKAVKQTSFTGVSGAFRLVNGQLKSSVFQIINIVGNGYKGVGFWTPESGLSSDLGFREGDKKLGTIVWPGDTTEVPKGWVATTGGKRLRVGFPIKYTFLEFVKYEEDPITKEKFPTGYSIEIFNSVMNALPYSVPFDYFPFSRSDGSSGSYDLLLQQIPENKYDIVAGDVTIMAHRFQYVDFALPYTGSGVYMIVPLREDNKRESLFVFMEPLTWQLWLFSFSFFIIVGASVAIIEWNAGNENFRGPPQEVVSNALYFAFSTLVFAHRQELRSSLSRAVVIVWVFAVLILSSTYTASLASILTAAKLKPAFADMNEVVKIQKLVGFPRGSFLADLLKPTFGENIVPLSNSDEYASALANGTVVAVFLELPYIQIFLKKYCKDYTMVGPTHRTAGLGFAFRKDSPLVGDVSKAVVAVTQSPLMDDIEKRWTIANDTSQCSRPDTGGSRITLHSLRGLFIITGIFCFVAVIASLVRKFLWGGFRVCWRWQSVRVSQGGEHGDDERDSVEMETQRINAPQQELAGEGRESVRDQAERHAAEQGAPASRRREG